MKNSTDISQFPDVERFLNFIEWLEKMDNIHLEEFKSNGERYYSLFRNEFLNK
jgi:hypothetical protein